MAERTLCILQQQTKPIKIVKWKVQEGITVPIGRLLLLYKFVEDQKPEQKKLKSVHAGTVHKIIAKEGDSVKPGETLLELKACCHPTIMNDMCAECGADLRKEDTVSTASVPMIHAIPDLKVSEELAQKLGRADNKRLIKDRKLVLLVDLDQTLIHTTNDNIPPNIKDVYHFQLYGPTSPWYHTRLRPGTHTFLNSIHNYYELHICTFGARNYAHTIAMFLDPQQKIFSNRILSRDECFDPTSKKANLKALFPCGDNMVCIIDDREDVWSHASNLIHVKPYHFFQHTGDINAPPGLDKHEDDNKAGVDLTKVVHKDTNEKVLKESSDEKDNTVKENVIEKHEDDDNKNENEINNSQKKEDVEMLEKNEQIEDNQNKDQNVDTSKKNSEQNDTDEKSEGQELQTQEVLEISASNGPTIRKRKKVCMICRQNIRKHFKLCGNVKCSVILHRRCFDNSKKVFKFDKRNWKCRSCLRNAKRYHNNDDIRKENESLHTNDNLDNKNSLNDNSDKPASEINTIVNKINEITGNVESQEKSIAQNSENSKVARDRKDVNNTQEIATSQNTIIENEIKSSHEHNHIPNNDDNLIEVEDPDDYLIYLEDILKRIHLEFYNEFDKMESGEIPDLKQVIPTVRNNVLKGCYLVFSGLVPTHIKLEESKAYQVARSLGATVTQDLADETTHLVAVRPGTVKVNAGKRKKNLKIITPDWLWCCAERWEHVDERIFPLNRKASKNRHPPPHCSPEHIPTYPEHKTPALRKRTPSGRFMDTINPLMSFSSDDIADMDKEVEDILDDDSDSSEDELKKPEPNDERVVEIINENSSSSSSVESLSGDYPRGFKRKQKDIDDPNLDDPYNSTEDDESPSVKFRRGESLDDLIDMDRDDTQESDGSMDPPDDVDDGEWNMMGAALEREFLANN